MSHNKEILKELDNKFLEIFSSMVMKSQNPESKEMHVKMWEGLERSLENDRQAFEVIFGHNLYEVYSDIISLTKGLILSISKDDCRYLGVAGNSYFSGCINVQDGIKEVPQNPRHIAYNMIQTFFRLRNETIDAGIKKAYHEQLREAYCDHVINGVIRVYPEFWRHSKEIFYAFAKRCKLCPVDAIEK